MKCTKTNICFYKYIILLFFVLIGFYCTNPKTLNYHAVVSVDFSGKAGEIVNGKPTFLTISEALNAVPKQNKTPFVIFIRPGRYYEKLSVEKKTVFFLGECRDETIITFDATGDTRNPKGGKYGTWGCATLQVTAPDFHAENLTIENGFDYPANAEKADDDSTKVQNAQAVALMTSAQSDRAVFRNCKISGYQDTVFPNTGRHYFYKCRIEGHVDFIFGAGQVVFEECDIVSRNRKNKKITGYITAPSTSISYPYGFLFVNCRLIKENPKVPKGSVCLGRPWHPNADLSISGSAVFVQCFMDDHIGDKGYARISARDSKGQKIWFERESDSRFFEYKSFGPGAILTPNRPTLDDNSAQWYKTEYVLNGWQP